LAPRLKQFTSRMRPDPQYPRSIAPLNRPRCPAFWAATGAIGLGSVLSRLPSADGSTGKAVVGPYESPLAVFILGVFAAGPLNKAGIPTEMSPGLHEKPSPFTKDGPGAFNAIFGLIRNKERSLALAKPTSSSRVFLPTCPSIGRRLPEEWDYGARAKDGNS